MGGSRGLTVELEGTRPPLTTCLMASEDSAISLPRRPSHVNRLQSCIASKNTPFSQ